MHHDLTLSLLLMLTISAVLFLGGFLLQRRQRSSVSLFVVHFTTVVMVAYLLCLWESPLLVQVLPFSAAIILGNWLPLFGALYAGVCVGASQIPQYRRFVFSASLLLLGAFSLIRPLTGVAPDCLDSPSDAQLLAQTTGSTCSAACAASLLRLHGIEVTEGEMAELCLTRQGTHWLGLYRGLKLKVAGTGLDVRVRRMQGHELGFALDSQGILSLSFHGRASGRGEMETAFSDQHGHSVLCLGGSGTGRVDVFDPSPNFGFERWGQLHLREVRDSVLLQLVSSSGQVVMPDVVRPQYVD